MLILLHLLAQATVMGTDDQARLAECLEIARTDPTTAIATADDWLTGRSGSTIALPNQCLGIAYTRLSRWNAAQDAFARSRAASSDPQAAARFGGMEGNAALAAGDNAGAEVAFLQAAALARQAGLTTLAGEIEADRSRALVALGRLDEAASALATAVRDAPQNADGWLLSATLTRRNGDLAAAQAAIETADALRPADPAIGLEAGVIAMLANHPDAARKSWNSVIVAAPDSAEAKVAQAYITQADRP